ncbi:MAG: prephenate dehydratase, partial [Stenotrophobium sp.]
LQPFADASLDLNRIESRPMKGAVTQDYFFFIDFSGHAQDQKVKKVLEEVRGNAAFFKILGSYPRAVM